MKNDMIFAFFLQISNHMWLDGSIRYQPWSVQDKWNVNNECDLGTWDKTVDFITGKYNMLVVDVGDGVLLDSHPEIAAPDAWSKDFLKKKLDELRARGIEPIPKMNFSMAHTTWQKEWRYRVGLPEYLDFCRDIISEVCDIFGHPRFFHLGLDEETPQNQMRRAIAFVRNEPVFWKDAYALFDICEKNGARPWVFSDYWWHYPDIFEKRMPTSVVQSNWYYREFNTTASNSELFRVRCFNRLDELGYDQIPAFSAIHTTGNPSQGIRYCKENLSSEHLLGFNEIPWRNTTEFEYLMLLRDAESMWQGRQKYYPETVK